jgi:hypothetical protein
VKLISEEHVFDGLRAAPRRPAMLWPGAAVIAAGVMSAPVHDVVLFTFAADWVGIGLAAVGVERRMAS